MAELRSHGGRRFALTDADRVVIVQARASKVVGMQRTLPIFFSLALLCHSAVAADAQDAVNCREWRMTNDDSDRARRLAACDRIIEDQNSAPTDRAEAYATRAEYRHIKGRISDAIADLDHALALSPNTIDWLRDRAHLLQLTGEHDRAIKDFDKVIAAQPEDGGMTFDRGWSFLAKRDETRGFADLSRAIELEPNDYRYRYTRGVEYAKRGQLDAALLDLSKAIALKGDETNNEINPYLLRAEIYEKTGDTEKAIADLTRATQFDPPSPPAYLNRAFLYERMGQLDRAIADYDKLIGLTPGDEYYVERRAALAEKLAARTDPSAAAAPPASPVVKIPGAAPPKTPEPEVQKPAEQRPEPGKKKDEHTPDGKHECRRYVAVSNMTISVACPD